MIEITRNLVRKLRTVFGNLETPSFPSRVHFSAGIEGLRVRVHQTNLLAEYHRPGELSPDDITVPVQALADFQGTDRQTVRMVATDRGSILVRWEDCGVPKIKEYGIADTTPVLGALPAWPALLAANHAGLIHALGDASQTTSTQSAHYALDHLELHGPTGAIAATDGRQLLIQSGWRFPWHGSLLVPASTFFARRALPKHQGALIGRTGSHVALKVGRWSIYLPIGLGRFPRIDTLLPRQSKIVCRAWLVGKDRAFLAKVLSRLPSAHADHAPITVELGERVRVRARDQDTGASATAAKDNPRYAVNHVQLRSTDGSIVATDGRQLLIQTGFQWSWTGEVLVPASTVFAARELPQDQAARVGKNSTHVVLVVGPWTFYLPIGLGHYPRVDEIVPRETNLKSHGRLDVEDCDFLARVLPRLPGGHEDNAPVTVDLNDHVHVRARASTGPITEAILARSEATGQPKRVAVNRGYLTRAVQLGLAEVHLVDATTPILFKDEKRKYVVMPLGSGIIAPSEDAICINSATPQTTNDQPSPTRRNTILNEPQTNGQNGHSAANGDATNCTSNHTSNGVRRRKGKSTGLAALIDEAESLKKALRDAYERSHELLRAIKRQRKQSQIVQRTMRDLKQLQSVDG